MNSMGPSHGFVKRLRKPSRFFEVVARPLDAVRKLVEADPARERELARHFRCKQPAAAPAWIPSDLDADVLQVVSCSGEPVAAWRSNRPPRRRRSVPRSARSALSRRAASMASNAGRRHHGRKGAARGAIRCLTENPENCPDQSVEDFSYRFNDRPAGYRGLEQPIISETARYDPMAPPGMIRISVDIS